MIFTEITESEYREFWEGYDNRCFLSAPEISHLRNDAKVFFLGVKSSSESSAKLLAAVMVRGTLRHFGKYDYYAPRGMLVDYTNRPLVSFFTKELKRFLGTHSGYVFRIDPNITLIQRDISGHIVAGGYNHSSVVKTLKNLGFKKAPYKENLSQVTWQFVLPVSSCTEDELYANLKPRTRHALKQALDLGITVRNLEFSELDTFYEIMASTATRKNFETRDLAYFKKMHQLFAPVNGVVFAAAVINPKKSLEELKSKLSAESKRTVTTQKAKKLQNDCLNSLNTRIKNFKKVFPQPKNQEVILSVGMFMTLQPEILHFFGGNVGEYLRLGGQYALQWEMILRAKRGGFSRYNFYGIPPNIADHPENYGVYEFKQGFSGYVEELIGEFELPLSWPYYLYKIKR